MQYEFPVFQCPVQVGYQSHVLPQFGVERRCEELVVVASFFLGKVHGHVGILQELASSGIVQRKNSNPNACRGVDLLVIHEKRLGHDLDEFARQAGGTFGS